MCIRTHEVRSRLVVTFDHKSGLAAHPPRCSVCIEALVRYKIAKSLTPMSSACVWSNRYIHPAVDR